MVHHTPLIATIAAGISLAFLLGLLAQRLRISPLIGYLAAGVVVGPFTPGYVADQALATELAEIGVILLMFGVGLHFSLKDLLSVRAIAIPGAIVQMAAATAMGMGVGYALGWPPISGFVFGLALSVASTVVLLRALQERRILKSARGRIAVGWLIVEDLAMVLALVLLPVLAQVASDADADPQAMWTMLGLTLAKVAAFVAVMLVVGRRVIPWVLHYVAHTGSRELFRLAVLAIALGVAFGSASLFGVSFALGAFFAGMILSESELSHRAAEETLPLRDAFAVLFFVSVGMLFDPRVLVAQPLQLAATVAVIVVGKSIAAYLIVRAFGHSNATALTVSASLAQIGEFSFILASLGVALGLLSDEAQSLVLAGAILSILVNPLAFLLADRLSGETASGPADKNAPPEIDLVPTKLAAHAVVVGYGRVGEVLAAGLRARGEPFLVVEVLPAQAERARAAGVETIEANAAAPAVAQAAGVAAARRIFVAIPNEFEAGQIVAQARAANAAIEIVGRAHSDEAFAHLKAMGADSIVMGEREIGLAMLSAASVPAGG